LTSHSPRRTFPPLTVCHLMSTYTHLKYDESKLTERLAAVGIARETTAPAQAQIAVP
jgi:hypothetical protein